jgi:hypothetical protein
MKKWRWLVAGALVMLNGLFLGVQVEPPKRLPAREAAARERR